MYIENPYFTKQELVCKVTGKYGIQSKALIKLIELRKAYGKPMVLTSAYRHYSAVQSESHPIEWKKGKLSGQHALGTAVDIKVNSGAEAYELMRLAFALGWTGIAYGGSFVHVDCRDDVPRVWEY